MTLPVRIPPVVERWDCHGCGRCCRAVIVQLSEADVARLQSQRWDQHPDYRGVRIMVRRGLRKRRYRLALTAENQCVFLTAQGRCRIHEMYGEAAKPLLCRMFPFQLAPLEGYAFVTLRRNCPSAAAEEGHTLAEQLETIRDLAAQRQAGPKPAGPPPLVAGHHAAWPDFLRVAEALERLVLDQRFPLVRRLAHGLKLCDLLEQCRLQNFSGPRLDQLTAMLETSALEQVETLFRDRQAPGRASALLFRQTALEYLRLHPDFIIQQSWRERWRLIVLAAAFARGRGRLPHIHACFPPNTFEALQEPFGHLSGAVLRGWMPILKPPPPLNAMPC